MSQLDITFGKKLRDEGIKQAVDHANEDSWGWSARVFKMFEKFLEVHEGHFMTEEFRQFAENNGLESPPSARAYGGVITRASKRGLIKKVGHAHVSNTRAHACFASVWIRN